VRVALSSEDAKHWIENIAPASRSEITVERYETLLRAHIVPGLGSIELQKLDGTAIDAFYASRREIGLAPLTIHHIHSLLGQILASAVKAKKLARSPKSDVQTKPRAERRDEIVVLTEEELGKLLEYLKGHWLYMPSLLSSGTGLRRGEVLGLRWQDVDLKEGRLVVTQQLKVVRNKLVIEPPKSKRSRRTIKIPAPVVAELERHRKDQLEQRLRLGLGGRPELVFTTPTGEMINPDTLSDAFRREAAAVKPITFHCLRHTHHPSTQGGCSRAYRLGKGRARQAFNHTRHLQPPAWRRGQRRFKSG
jgi:integrase